MEEGASPIACRVSEPGLLSSPTFSASSHPVPLSLNVTVPLALWLSLMALPYPQHLTELFIRIKWTLIERQSVTGSRHRGNKP